MERKGTCGVCGKVRKLKRFKQWYWRCSECFDLPEEEAKAIFTQRKMQPRKPRLAYPCIGGPLDGEHATTVDFMRAQRKYNYETKEFIEVAPEGMYNHLATEYIEYNCAGGSSKTIGGWPPSMIFIHRDSLPALASPKDR